MRTAGIVLIVCLVATAACLFIWNGSKNAQFAAEFLAAADDPDIELLDLDGRTVDLWRSHPNRVVVAIFTRSDCPISNRYAPDVRAALRAISIRRASLSI